jgi:NADPH2:quinone reductase
MRVRFLWSLTAWEMLVDHFGIEPEAMEKNGKEAILIVNGAGGVGSAAIQLAKVFGLGEVVVTASRGETIKHVKELGATVVIDHHQKLQPQLKEKGIEGVKYIMICHFTPLYVGQACEIAKAWGKIGSIVECEEQLELPSMAAFTKALSFHWEFMFVNAMSGDDELMKRTGA